MKILVTGAAGFIGMTTSLRLLARGDEVVGLDNLNDYYEVSLKENRLARLTSHANFRFIKLDVGDRAGMEALFASEKFDKVIHLAAQAGVRYSLQNPHAYIDSNLVGFTNILEGCRHNRWRIWFTPPAPASMAAIPRCRSRNTTASTIRSASTPPAKRPTS